MELSIEDSIDRHPNMSIKLKASPTPCPHTAFFSIHVSCMDRDSQIPIRLPGPRETISFRFNRFLGSWQLQTVVDKLSSLTRVRDLAFFGYFQRRLFAFCYQAMLAYRDRGVQFCISASLWGPSVPRLREMSFIDEVVVFDSVSEGGRIQQNNSGVATIRLERVRDVGSAKLTSGQCSICLEEFDPMKDSDLRRTPCAHVFHHRCVKRWLERRQTCPLCRSDVRLT